MKICTKVNQYLKGKGVNLGRSGPLYRARKARMARETLLKWLESHETSRDELFGQPRDHPFSTLVIFGHFDPPPTPGAQYYLIYLSHTHLTTPPPPCLNTH